MSLLSPAGSAWQGVPSVDAGLLCIRSCLTSETVVPSRKDDERKALFGLTISEDSGPPWEGMAGFRMAGACGHGSSNICRPGTDMTFRDPPPWDLLPIGLSSPPKGTSIFKTLPRKDMCLNLNLRCLFCTLPSCFYLCSTLCLTVSKSSVACDASACSGSLGPRGLPTCYNTFASTAPEVPPSPVPPSVQQPRQCSQAPPLPHLPHSHQCLPRELTAISRLCVCCVTSSGQGQVLEFSACLGKYGFCLYLRPASLAAALIHTCNFIMFLYSLPLPSSLFNHCGMR